MLVVVVVVAVALASALARAADDVSNERCITKNNTSNF